MCSRSISTHHSAKNYPGAPPARHALAPSTVSALAMAAAATGAGVASDTSNIMLHMFIQQSGARLRERRLERNVWEIAVIYLYLV